MNISEFSVKNWQFMLVLFIGVVALGVNSLLTMPRGEDPEVNAPQFAVVFVYPGTDAATSKSSSWIRPRSDSMRSTTSNTSLPTSMMVWP